MKKPVPVPAAGRYKTALANLQAAYAIIKRPGRWTQNHFNEDCEGYELKVDRSPKSVAFCALGAVKFVNGPGEKKAQKLLQKAAVRLIRDQDRNDSYGDSDDSIFQVNDDSDYKAAKKNVLKMFRMAIEAARGIR